MADHDLLVALRERVPDLGGRIERRELYKRAVWTGLDRVPDAVSEMDRGDERRAAREIAEVAGVDRESVLVDIPTRPGLKEARTRVVVDDVVQRLEDASELVSALRRSRRAQWRLGVYTPDGQLEAVEAAAADVLGLSA